MSMRIYGTDKNCMIIEKSELQKLIIENKKSIKKVLEETTNEYLKDISDRIECENIDIEVIEVLSTNIPMSYLEYEFSGYLDSEDITDRIYFDNEVCLIIDLRKNTLFDKYNNVNEIIDEFKEDFEEIGINIDDEYVKKHFGYVNGYTYS